MSDNPFKRQSVDAGQESNPKMKKCPEEIHEDESLNLNLTVEDVLECSQKPVHNIEKNAQDIANPRTIDMDLDDINIPDNDFDYVKMIMFRVKNITHSDIFPKQPIDRVYFSLTNGEKANPQATVEDIGQCLPLKVCSKILQTEEQCLKQKIHDLKCILSNEEAFLVGLNLQLESARKQTTLNRDISLSLTNSTDYYDLQEDFGKTQNVNLQLPLRDNIVKKLVESLQKSIFIRENLQKENEKLTENIQNLREQLSESTAVSIPNWEKYREADKFQEGLSIEETLAFNTCQKKIFNFINESCLNFKWFLENRYENFVENLKQENNKLKKEMNKLQAQYKQENLLHSKEMESLRKYFEQKCSDIEKQFSNDVIFLKSQQKFNYISPESQCDYDDKENSSFKCIESEIPKTPSMRKRLRTRSLQSASYPNLEDFNVISGKNKHKSRSRNLKNRKFDHRKIFTKTSQDDKERLSCLLFLCENFDANNVEQMARLQVKHKEEMDYLKQDYEGQLRHTKFDLSQDTHRDKLLEELNRLRELSGTFRFILSQLLLCIINYEEDLIITVLDEAKRLLFESNIPFIDNENSALVNCSLNSSLAQGSRLAPGIQQLQKIVDHRELVEYIERKTNSFQSKEDSTIAADDIHDIGLQYCLQQLRVEASKLLELSGKLCAERNVHESLGQDTMKNQQQEMTVLKPSMKLNLSQTLISDLQSIRSRLEKSEDAREILRDGINNTITRNLELSRKVQSLDEFLSKREERIEFVEEHLQTSHMPMLNYPAATCIEKNVQDADVLLPPFSFLKLQEKARHLISVEGLRQETSQESSNAREVLLQMVEDFCHEGDKIMEFFKRTHENLQSQIDNADKQLKATRQFLEEQAAEREQERDEYSKEIKGCQQLLRCKDKDLNKYSGIFKEVQRLEQHVTVLAERTAQAQLKNENLEIDLKAALEKIFVLREIIASLEAQLDQKILHENILLRKIQDLEAIVVKQSQTSISLQAEIETLRIDIRDVYEPRTQMLQEKLENEQPSSGPNLLLQEITEKIRNIELCLNEKTKALEVLYNGSISNSSSLSVTEDISANMKQREKSSNLQTPNISCREYLITMSALQNLMLQLEKHYRAEEAAIKYLRDLEAHVKNALKTTMNLQIEHDTEETQKQQLCKNEISQSTQQQSKVKAKSHCISEVHNLYEIMKARDEQISFLQEKLQNAKAVIGGLEAELALKHEPRSANVEQQVLERKIPNLMEEKNCETDQRNKQEKFTECSSSDVDSLSFEPDRPDTVRRTMLPSTTISVLQLTPANNMGLPEIQQADSIEKGTSDAYFLGVIRQTSDLLYTNFLQPPILQSLNNTTPILMPRKINFSSMTVESKGKSPCALGENLEASELRKESPNCTLFIKMTEVVQGLEKEVNEKENKNAELKAQISEMIKEIDELQQNLNIKNEEVLNYKKNISQLENQLKSSEKELMEKNNKLSELLLNTENTVVAAQKRQLEIHAAEENVIVLQQQINALKTALMQAQQQKQQNSDNSSRQFSVDEIARKVEKELNYSVQLDSNILKAIESEEENITERESPFDNLESRQELERKIVSLCTKLYKEREYNKELRLSVLIAQQRAQETQKHDLSIIEQMRELLELALEDKERLVRQAEQHRFRIDMLQNQLNRSPKHVKNKKEIYEIQAELNNTMKENICLRQRLLDLQHNLDEERKVYKELLQKYQKEVKHFKEHEERQHKKRRTHNTREHSDTKSVKKESKNMLDSLEQESREVGTEYKKSFKESNVPTNQEDLQLKIMNAEVDSDSIQNLRKTFVLRERELVESVAQLKEHCQYMFALHKREESFRKALIYQKRYLMISVETYKRKLSKLANNFGIIKPQSSQINYFKTVALSIIAIKRMQYIVQLWQSGKRPARPSTLVICQSKLAKNTEEQNYSRANEFWETIT